VLLGDGASIEPAHLMLEAGTVRQSGATVRPLDVVEREAVEQALEAFDGDVMDAAEALGLSRSAMYRRLDKYAIKPGESDA